MYSIASVDHPLPLHSYSYLLSLHGASCSKGYNRFVYSVNDFTEGLLSCSFLGLVRKRKNHFSSEILGLGHTYRLYHRGSNLRAGVRGLFFAELSCNPITRLTLCMSVSC